MASVVETEIRRRRSIGLRGGPDGNERLASALGLLLLVLLPVEAATTLSLHDYLSVHLFLGLLLIPPVGVKLATTGWRFGSYYLRNEPYRLKGPPDLFLRLLAPPLVLSTIVLFGTGVAFLVVGHGGGLLLTAHAASFIAFGGLVTVHSLAYLTRAWRHGSTDWRRAGGDTAGSRWRKAVVAVALLAGVAVALGTYSAQTSWLGNRHHQHERFADRS